ncbi:MAG: threonylcarbamoyl-AMP synthase [Thiotrichales bacterium]|nr:threonylcarbamoyl-AMP synthase [Thiotrichales bacterium]
MDSYLRIHPDNPQPRLIDQAASVLHAGGVVAWPTDSCYALACRIGDKTAQERIHRIRRLDKNHHMTLVCRDLSEIGSYAKISNQAYRLIKSLTPGPYTFLLPATRDVPRRLQHSRRKTIGLRVPGNEIAQELLNKLDEPILSTSLILPGERLPMTDPEEIFSCLQGVIELVIDGGAGGLEATTMIDLTTDEQAVIRAGKGKVNRA